MIMLAAAKPSPRMSRLTCIS